MKPALCTTLVISSVYVRGLGESAQQNTPTQLLLIVRTWHLERSGIHTIAEAMYISDGAKHTLESLLTKQFFHKA